jgi:sugar/nucleoside kinase (ribokinase family)
MADIAVYGSPAVDIVLEVESVPTAGAHVNAQPVGWRLGGSSANLACGLSIAGHDVRLVGYVGDDPLGNALVGSLAERGIDTRYVVRTSGPTARALILLDSSGERTIVALRNAVVPDLPPVPQPTTTFDCVYVESFLRGSTGDADTAAPLVVAALPPPVACQWPADVLVGSAEQLPEYWRPSPFAAARAVAGRRLKFLVITEGPLGVHAYGPDETVHVPALTAVQRDATGAGDAFAAGLVDGLLGGAGMYSALKLGCAWGAQAVQVLQSVPPDWHWLVDIPSQPLTTVGHREAPNDDSHGSGHFMWTAGGPPTR